MEKKEKGIKLLRGGVSNPTEVGPMPETPAPLRAPESEWEKTLAETFKIKRPLIVPDPDGLHLISGICYYCEDPWDIELEIALKDSETGELNGRSVTVYICKSCRTAGKPAVEEDRLTVTGVR